MSSKKLRKQGALSQLHPSQRRPFTAARYCRSAPSQRRPVTAVPRHSRLSLHKYNQLSHDKRRQRKARAHLQGLKQTCVDDPRPGRAPTHKHGQQTDDKR
eukprot:365310-Chlamydomonas_euryale.AAC.7